MDDFLRKNLDLVLFHFLYLLYSKNCQKFGDAIA